MIDLGAQYPLAVDIFDGNGNPANAATVTATITLPDGSSFSPALSNPPDVTGQYRYAYTTVQSGRHVVKVTTASPATAWRDVFDVGADVIPSIVSLADAKDFLGIDPADTSEDDELRAWLAGTTEVVERVKNEVIAARQFTATDWNNRGHSLRLWKVPVISLDSLASYDGLRTWDPAADVYTSPETGLVRLISGQSLHGLITRTWTAGYRVVPYHVMQGSLVLLQHVWETQRGPGTIGGGVVGPEESGDVKQMYMVPRKVREWLGNPRPSII